MQDTSGSVMSWGWDSISRCANPQNVALHLSPLPCCLPFLQFLSRENFPPFCPAQVLVLQQCPRARGQKYSSLLQQWGESVDGTMMETQLH